MYDVGNRRLRTGEVAERAGVNIQTLRYYERRGLITEPDRSPGGHRTYPADTVTLVGVIKAAQRLSFTLDEVAELLDTVRRGHPTADLKARAAVKITEVDRKIADLSTIRDALACAACCALPVLITAGVLIGAGAALAQHILLGTAGALMAAAATMWWLHRRRSAPGAAAAGVGGCASDTCSC
jgi:DNA-binding transcriptional MerR regulator